MPEKACRQAVGSSWDGIGGIDAGFIRNFPAIPFFLHSRGPILLAGVDSQIHTHMCYSDFNDIMAAIAAMDTDVISIETSRSQMEQLNAFVDFSMPGPRSSSR